MKNKFICGQYHTQFRNGFIVQPFFFVARNCPYKGLIRKAAGLITSNEEKKGRKTNEWSKSV